MKKAGILIPAFFLLTICKAVGQVYFDELYGRNDAVEGLARGSTVLFGDSYVNFSAYNQDRWILQIFITNLLGVETNEFEVLTPDTISEISKNIICVDNAYFIGLSYFRNLNESSSIAGDIMLSAFDFNGTIYWRRLFGDTNRTESPQNFVEVDHKGLAVLSQTVNYVDGNDDGQVHLLKVDSLGNQVWEQEYGGALYESGSSLLQTPDQGFLLLGWTRSFGNGQRDFYLTKTDSLGEQEWQRTYGDEGFDSGSSIIALSDGNYLLAGYRNLSERRQGYMYKIDPIGTIIWENEYGESNTTEEFNKVIELPNGDIVAAGLYDPFGASVQQSDNGGLLVKTDGEGNELWRRTYQKNENTDLFYSVLLAEDGGFLLSGQARNAETNSQDAWLLKVDSVGCPYPNCLVGVDEAEPSKVMMDVWPNPVEDALNIEIAGSSTQLNLHVFDISGKEMLRFTQYDKRATITTTQWNSGMYILKGTDESGRMFSLKIVKQ